MLVVPARFHSGFANLSVSLWVLVNLPRRAGLIGPELCRFPGISLLGSSVNRSSFLCGVAKDPAFLVGGGNNKAGKNSV